jgi:MATE family multidrug resistance protein
MMEVIKTGASMFIIWRPFEWRTGCRGTCAGASRGMMDNFVPVRITMVSYWIIALPIGYVLGFVWDGGPNSWIGCRGSDLGSLQSQPSGSLRKAKS